MEEISSDEEVKLTDFQIKHSKDDLSQIEMIEETLDFDFFQEAYLFPFFHEIYKVII
jgi:hypothetical protein